MLYEYRMYLRLTFYVGNIVNWLFIYETTSFAESDKNTSRDYWKNSETYENLIIVMYR